MKTPARSSEVTICYESLSSKHVFFWSSREANNFKHELTWGVLVKFPFKFFSTGTLAALQLLGDYYKGRCWTAASTTSCQTSHWDDSINCTLSGSENKLSHEVPGHFLRVFYILRGERPQQNFCFPSGFPPDGRAASMQKCICSDRFRSLF